MKKVLLFAAATAAVLSSCSKNEVVDSNLDNQAVGFGVYTATSTKSGVSDEMTTAGLQGTGFGVFAFHDYATQDSNNGGVLGEFSTTSTPDFMYNTKVSTADWTYSPMKYWPNNTNDVLSFFAYGPYSDNGTDATGITFKAADKMTGIPVLSYSIADADKMVDFVAAAPDYNNANTTDYNKKQDDIEFNFKHLLTRAKFEAYVDVTDFPDVNTDDNTEANDNTVNAAETKVYVTKMVIVGSDGTTTNLVDKTNSVITEESKGLVASADFTYNASDDDNTVGDIRGIGSWGNYKLYNKDFDFSSILNKTTTKFGDYTPNGVDVKTTATPLFIQADADQDIAEKYLFLLGPDGGIIAGDTDVYVYIEYDVVTLDTDLDGGYSVVTNKDVVSLAPGTLAQGYAFKYTLVIGLDEVTVTAGVEGWGNVENTNIVTPAK